MTYTETSITIFVERSLEINSEKGIEGLFSFWTTKANNLETSPTTSKSQIPVIIASGIILYKDFLLLLDRIFRSLINKFIVLLSRD